MNTKKLILSIIGVVMIIGLIITYQYYSKEQKVMDHSLFASRISYAQLQDHIRLSSDTQAYLLCEQDHDCDYVMYSLLKPLMRKYNISVLNHITFVDMDDVIRQVSPTRLRELFSIQSLPAFVIMDTSTQHVISTLEYHKTSPLVLSVLEEWLLINGLLR